MLDGKNWQLDHARRCIWLDWYNELADDNTINPRQNLNFATCLKSRRKNVRQSRKIWQMLLTNVGVAIMLSSFRSVLSKTKRVSESFKPFSVNFLIPLSIFTKSFSPFMSSGIIFRASSARFELLSTKIEIN